MGLASSDFVHADVNEPVIVDGLAGLDLSAPQDAAAAVYDRPIGIRLLFEDPDSGEEHYLVRYPPGVRGRAHRHTAAHTMVVLEGQLDVGDRVVGPGSYVHFPGQTRMRHQATADGPCLFVLIFHGPFNVEIVD
jgi:quercetin dioxygenase-like cupin family protein